MMVQRYEDFLSSCLHDMRFSVNFYNFTDMSVQFSFNMCPSVNVKVCVCLST